MSKFKVGDRVAVYGHFRVSGEMRPDYLRGDRGLVTCVIADDEITVCLDSGVENEVHPKQCRKLKPKKKPLRVEGVCYWIEEPSQSGFKIWAIPANHTGKELNNAAFDQFIGKRTKITVEVIE